MDKDRIKGAVKEAEGQLQKAKGKITGSETDKAEGAAKVAGGKIEKKFGQVKDAVRKAVK
jgi:uncharacterized protein YjbJ (UPF0337 family)